MTEYMTVKELMAILTKYDENDTVELSADKGATLEIYKNDFSKFETIIEVEDYSMC